MRQRLQQVLEQTSVTDAQFTFDAIALAKPAGLGVASQHDVHQVADCNLLQAMQSATERDLIALQYTNAFEAIFNLSLPILAQINADNIPFNHAWLTTRLYLNLLATFSDSHIVRKHGATVAGQIQQQANEHLVNFSLSENPKTYQRQLLDWDRQLKQQGVNPGTSADLTVASLLAYELTKLTVSK